VRGHRARALVLGGLLAVVEACAGGGPSPSDGPASIPSPSPGGVEPTGGRLVPVTSVVDGDTFHVLRNGRDVSIRLIGIDTPEVHWYGGEAECYGARAGVFVRRVLHGSRVRLQFDQERIDPYGRTLAYAYLEDGRMLNELLVRRGFATVTIYEPNDRYEGRLRRAEASARTGGAGIWSACD
jgi:micrococcal nuclease